MAKIPLVREWYKIKLTCHGQGWNEKVVVCEAEADRQLDIALKKQAEEILQVFEDYQTITTDEWIKKYPQYTAKEGLSIFLWPLDKIVEALKAEYGIDKT